MNTIPGAISRAKTAKGLVETDKEPRLARYMSALRRCKYRCCADRKVRGHLYEPRLESGAVFAVHVLSQPQPVARARPRVL